MTPLSSAEATEVKNHVRALTLRAMKSAEQGSLPPVLDRASILAKAAMTYIRMPTGENKLEYDIRAMELLQRGSFRASLFLHVHVLASFLQVLQCSCQNPISLLAKLILFYKFTRK